MTGFIKNKGVLEEGCKVEDLLDFSSEVQRLEDSVKRVPYSSLFGYVGKFGSGKSTTIYQMQKKSFEDNTTKWFEFDAWKYPERRDLWEGFVLDVADQLGNRKKAQKKIEGSKDTGKTVGAVAQIAQTLGVIPGLSYLVEKFSYLFDGQPIERVFELQNLLDSMLSALEEKDIFIVVEDLDRSGDAGRYFLETLRQFIKNHLPDKRIIVLVPIGTEIYDNDSEHRASYQKVLDYILFFEPKGVKFTRFIEEVFESSAFPSDTQVEPNVKQRTPWKEQLEDWFSIATSNGLTIREIKVALRSANLSYENLIAQGFEADSRVVLAFTLLNHIFSEGGRRWITRIRFENPIPVNCPVSTFLQTVARGVDSKTFAESAWRKAPIKFIEEDRLPLPAYKQSRADGNEGNYFLSAFYLFPFGYASK